MLILLSSSTKIYSLVKLAPLVMCRMFKAWFCMYVYGLCICSDWVSTRDPAFIGGQRLFETRRLFEVLKYTCLPKETF